MALERQRQLPFDCSIHRVREVRLAQNDYRREGDMNKGFDPKCLELARHFLADCPDLTSANPKVAEELAQEIQGSVEQFINFERGDRGE